jgi:putative methionine-R-sulfoxide reductase with GAF domain
MTGRSRLDLESFQSLLSDAYAVQESGVSAVWLTPVIELQRKIAIGELDVDRAIDLITVGAQDVANATGIVIGLLKGDQLVYRAGSGSGVAYVGKHVMSTLCVSRNIAAKSEILRVEDAHTDKRIEAAICRQFGAQSLLILPLYHDDTLVGVLDVLFDEPHAFPRPEVLAYRLMGALVGEAMSYAARPDRQQAPAAAPSTVPQSVSLTGPRTEEPLNYSLYVNPSITNNSGAYHTDAPFIAQARKLLTRMQSAWAASNRAEGVPWNKGRLKAVGVAIVVLVVACWIALSDRRSRSPHVLGQQGSTALEQQVPVTPAKLVLSNATSKAQPVLAEEEQRWTARTIPSKVSDRAIRIRYISDDVTVRYFTPKPLPQHMLAKNIRVRQVSDDVTVRYFPSEPPVSPSSLPSRSTAQPVDR